MIREDRPAVPAGKRPRLGTACKPSDDPLQALWSRQVPFLYELMARCRLSQPASRARTLAWLPGLETESDDGSVLQHLVTTVDSCRSSVAAQEQSSSELLVLAVKLRSGAASADKAGSQEQKRWQLSAPRSEAGAATTVMNKSPGGTSPMGRTAQYGSMDSRVVQRLPQAGSVTRSLVYDKAPHWLALRTSAGEVQVYDAAAHRLVTRERCRLLSRLAPPRNPAAGLPPAGAQGDGLAWSPNSVNELAATDPTGKFVGLWHVEGAQRSCQIASPNAELISGLAFHPSCGSTLCMLASSGSLAVHDSREASSRRDPAVLLQLENATCMAASQLGLGGTTPATLAVGCSDSTVRLLDPRALGRGPWHTLRAHGEQRRTKTVHRGGGGCLDLGWSPLAAGLLATSTESGSVLLWDLSCIGARQASEEAAEAAPELAFLHGGHVRTGKRHCAGLPVAWSREVDFLLASSAFTADDSKGAQAKSSVANVPGHGGADVHVWRPSRLLVP
eukprot:TRINITY_DN26086_c0_g1_i2.p1 TRINITY_DN26086_c0_g1~~TRINITY_DN26086_c0_g1_i2.p1  ORF type:complete len:503 (-),score=82.95 TRINITY_DN26086_c0_g1_i2:172-1680(-)